MFNITDAIGWVTTNMNTIGNIAAWIIAVASIVVKFAPQLEDNHVFKGILRILGKIALNRSNPK